MEFWSGLHFLWLSLCLFLICPRLAFSDEIEGSVLKLNRGLSSKSFDPARVTQLSWHPRAFLYKGFLSDAECDHLIELARDSLEKSMVADDESGKSIESEIRTSSGTFLSKAQVLLLNVAAEFSYCCFGLMDEVVTAIEQRIATWTFLPVVKPEKGDALLFFSLHPDATTDPASLHGSCPVIEGEKWSATKWIHVRSFEESIAQLREGGCRDENENCEKWAKAGECEKNPQYMVGTDQSVGFCRKSCKVCSMTEGEEVVSSSSS
ncbi:Probable prolyl 4-hydroxylase 4 [Linum grandiflorum]